MSDAVQCLPRYELRQSVLRREVAILVAGILAIFIACALTWYLLSYRGSPAFVVRQFIEADRAGVFSEEQRLVSSRWDSRMILALLQNVRQQSGASPFDKYLIQNVAISGETAEVGVQITLPASANLPVARARAATSTYVSFSLVRENGDWKIDPTQTMSSLTGIILSLGLNNLGQGLLPPGGMPGIGPSGPGPIIPPPSMPTTPSGPSIL